MSQRFSLYLCRTAILYPLLICALLLLGAGECFGQALALTQTNTSACTGPNSVVTAIASGGAGPGSYSYAIDVQPLQPGNVFPGQAYGPHTLTVNDGVNTVTISFTVGCIQLNLDSYGSSTCGLPNGLLAVSALSATGGINTVRYSIDNGVTWQSTGNFPNLLGTATYTILAMDANNTTQTITKTVFGIPPATVTGAPTDASCVNNDGTITATPSGTLMPFFYALDNQTFGPGNVFNGVSSGPHTLYIQDGNNCITSTPVTVLLDNTLTVATQDATVCEGKRVQLGASANLTNSTFSWSPATGLSSTTVANPQADPSTTTTYTVTATSGACNQAATATVNVNPAPVADAGAPVTTCYGKNVQLNGSGAAIFNWRPATFLDNPNSGTPTAVDPTATTTYSLQVTDGNGCTSINNATVTMTVTPPPQIFAGNDTSVAAGQPVPLHAVDVFGVGFATYQWMPSAGVLYPDSSYAVWMAATPGVTSFVVKGTTAAGCVGLDTVVVKVFDNVDLYVPNAFSPNHDGHNDVLRVIAPSIRELKVFAVYDRWGAQVFTTSNTGVGWDGTRNGQMMPAGVYVWMAVGVDYAGKTVERRGTVVLVR